MENRISISHFCFGRGIWVEIAHCDTQEQAVERIQGWMANNKGKGMYNAYDRATGKIVAYTAKSKVYIQ